MKVLVFLEKADVRGGIEIFAERHVARLRAEGNEVEVAQRLEQSSGACGDGGGNRTLMAVCGDRAVPVGGFDEIVVHKCTDVGTLALFPPDNTTYYVHDHEPICPRAYAYTPFGRNCSCAGGIIPCIFCAPACRSWKAAFGRVFAQSRRRRVMARFRKIVVISEFMKARLVANGLPAGRIAVEPPVIRVAAPAGAVDHDIDLLFVGQLIRGKGVQLLLKAMSMMRAPRTLDIVGSGNMEAKLKALAARLGIEGRVRFNGFRDNPQDWMRRAACVVVPSFWQEPYGLVAAEAVALGRPVVAFAIGGLPEACGGKATLVPPGDVAALAKALEKA